MVLRGVGRGGGGVMFRGWSGGGSSGWRSGGGRGCVHMEGSGYGENVRPVRARKDGRKMRRLLPLLLCVYRLLFPRLSGSDVPPMMPHLHFSRSIAISGLSPLSFMSPFNRSLQVIFGLPLATPAARHFKIPTSTHPIIRLLPLDMPEPPQSTTPHNLYHTLNSKPSP